MKTWKPAIRLGEVVKNRDPGISYGETHSS